MNNNREQLSNKSPKDPPKGSANDGAIGLAGAQKENDALYYRETFEKVRQEFSKAVIGQERIIDMLLITLLCRGHVLIEGVPGIAKTLIVKTFATISNCSFSRVQFTPDLLPTDITGVVTYDEIRKFHVIKGPIFANFVLADEINRTSPKVQSALLEAMQEHQVTIGKENYPLPTPFFVLATMNPIETLGTYELPEAQLDRFLFKLEMTYPKKEEEESILEKNSLSLLSNGQVSPILSVESILELQRKIHGVYLDPQLKNYIINLIDATRYPKEYSILLGKYIQLGASPRASIGLYLASKARAFIKARSYVTPHDIKALAKDILRHRIILNYEAQAENIKTDDIIDEILSKVVVP